MWSCLRNLVLMLVGLGACGGADTPEPPTVPAPSPVTDKAAVAEVSSEPVVVALEAPESLGMASHGGWSAAEMNPEMGPPHPAPEEGMVFAAIPYGLGRVVLGYAPGPDGWTVSADLDADGQLSASEQVAMVGSETGVFRGTLRGHIVRGDVKVPVSVQTAVEDADGILRVRFGAEQVRSGQLPGGVAVVVTTHGGLYDHPEATITVDENGDGKPDLENWIVRYAVADRVVAARGQRWEIYLSPDGESMTVSPTDEPLVGLRAGLPAPPFSVVASDGETHDLARYSGSPLLIDFWATWCAPCIALHPEVEALAGRHKLSVIGISANDTQVEVDRWLKKNPTPWPSAAIGLQGEANLAYGISQWPSHALIDAEGRLVVLGSFAAIRRALGETI